MSLTKLVFLTQLLWVLITPLYASPVSGRPLLGGALSAPRHPLVASEYQSGTTIVSATDGTVPSRSPSHRLSANAHCSPFLYADFSESSTDPNGVGIPTGGQLHRCQWRKLILSIRSRCAHHYHSSHHIRHCTASRSYVYSVHFTTSSRKSNGEHTVEH